MSDFKRGIHDGIPIALGYISVSFTFGLQAVSSGLKWWEALLISLTNLTSAGQFAGLGIICSGAGFWLEMSCTQFIIDLRYSLMSVSLSQKTDKSVSGIHRWIAGFGITDEIFAVAMGHFKKVNLIVACILAFKEKSLLTVAIFACLAVLAVDLIGLVFT